MDRIGWSSYQESEKTNIEKNVERAIDDGGDEPSAGYGRRHISSPYIGRPKTVAVAMQSKAAMTWKSIINRIRMNYGT